MPSKDGTGPLGRGPVDGLCHGVGSGAEFDPKRGGGRGGMRGGIQILSTADKKEKQQKPKKTTEQETAK